MGHALKKCLGDSGSSKAPPEVRKDFEKALNVLYQKRESLDKYLTELDDSKKVLCKNISNQTIAEQAERYVMEILLGVERQDARFKSTFLRSGSFYDEVKVGLPDEYDYMAKLEHLCKPGLGRAEPTKLGFVRLVVEDLESIELWKEFLVEDTNDNGQVVTNVLSITMVKRRFNELVDKAMKSVAMPQNWRSNPGSLLHGPCAMFLFLVDGYQAEDPLRISIDLAPCVTYPNYGSVQFPFYKHLKDENASALFLEDMLATEPEVLLVPFTHDGIRKSLGGSSWQYIYRDQMRVSFSMSEKAIFSQFTSDSVEKRLMRVLKILRDAHLRDYGSLEHWEESLPVPDEPPSTRVQVTSVQPLISRSVPDELETSSDLAEGEVHIGSEAHKDLLQTYIFKSLLFYAKLYQDNWFSGNLADAVLKCLEALFDIYSTPHSAVQNFFFDGHTGKAPSERSREKILRRLVQIVVHLKLQIELQ
ncbi:hypothetical protein QZH41_003776 [Actinostola sp. cb2023]|nr:hypothetical protein QZH41_003776 [Actinostola sp. cb2023]